MAPSRTKKRDIPFDRDADDQVLLNQVIDYYHEALQQSPEALAYLDKRGLHNPELIEHFKLGFANRTLGYRLPEKSRKAGAEVRGQLQTIGLLRSSGHEHFNGSLVIPVMDDTGNVTEVYGRKVTPKLRPGTPLHLYLPGPHRGVWNADGLAKQKEVILCEALIDALTFWAAGYHNVTASYGVEGFTADHLHAFKAAGIERVLIAYDRDAAGNAAAEKLAKQLQRDGFACYRLNFPKGMDANAYALHVQPASKSLGVVIRSAQWLGDGEAPERESIGDVHRSDPGSASPLVAELPCESEASALPAAAVPSKPENPTSPEVTDHEITIAYGDRHYRVRGLQKNTSYEVMKVNVLVKCHDALHVDTFDLYSAKHRQAFARVAAGECGIEDKTVQRDLGRLLLQLESLQDKIIQAALTPKEPAGYTMDDAEREQALELLKDCHLAERIVADFKTTDQCPDGLLGSGVAQVEIALSHHRTVHQRGGQKRADGRGVAVRTGRGPGAVLGDDRAESVLSGRIGSETQDPWHCRGRGRASSRLRVEVAAKRRGADHCIDGQRPRVRQAGDRRIPGRRPGDAVFNHHGHRHRRRAS
ncbi:MAG TPA: toprim domain-containing protein [Mizugakiibacter sp.]|nr:toprim domain-containing protein [Mizugakiibacter sp.]